MITTIDLTNYPKLFEQMRERWGEKKFQTYMDNLSEIELTPEQRENYVTAEELLKLDWDVLCARIGRTNAKILTDFFR